MRVILKMINIVLYDPGRIQYFPEGGGVGFQISTHVNKILVLVKSDPSEKKNAIGNRTRFFYIYLYKILNL